jgi:uncharacterized protein YecE (DUF72 family)
MSNIYIGTSGFSYREWIGKFYPKGIKVSELLSYYANHFNAVEINSTFYMEFRNSKLLVNDTFCKLHAMGIAICFNDAFMPVTDWPEPEKIAYLRLRNGPYSRDDLKTIARKVKSWSKKDLDCFIFFKHDESAPDFAEQLSQIVGIKKR